MRSWFRTWGVLAVLVAVARAEPPAAKDLPIRDIRLPVQLYPDGTLKTEVTARGASMPAEDGTIVGRGVSVNLYEEDGKTLEGRITADNCLVNKEAGTAKSDGPVRMVRSGVVITGTGFRWLADENKVRILRDVKVKMNRRKVLKDREHALKFREAR